MLTGIIIYLSSLIVLAGMEAAHHQITGKGCFSIIQLVLGPVLLLYAIGVLICRIDNHITNK